MSTSRCKSARTRTQPSAIGSSRKQHCCALSRSGERAAASFDIRRLLVDALPHLFDGQAVEQFAAPVHPVSLDLVLVGILALDLAVDAHLRELIRCEGVGSTGAASDVAFVVIGEPGVMGGGD